MKKDLDRKFLWLSIFIHLIIFFFVSIFYSDSRIKRPFLVLGAYSKNPTIAYFHPLKAPINFKPVQTKSSSSIQKKSGNKVKAPAKKATEKKVIAPKKTGCEVQSNKKLISKKVSARKKPKKSAYAKATADRSKVVEKKIEVKKEVEKKVESEEKMVVTENLDNEKSETINLALFGDRDPSLLKYHESIQKEVCRIWKPPLGASKGTECTVNFVVDKKGNVKEFNIVTPSKMLIYDLSIVKVAKGFVFDECLQGKTFCITFRQ